MKKIGIACALGVLLTAGAVRALASGPASDRMRRCEALICAEKERLGLFDPETDPGRSGLIGVEFSPLTTSLGELADKQAAARPEMADAVAEYLRRAGVASGDWVAVNASASFPGFCLAALCAAETMGAHVQLVFSYGSSMYGGTQPEFTFPVMLDLLNAAGLLRTRLRAVSAGGAQDRMAEVLMEDPLPVVRALMDSRSEEKIEADGLAGGIRRRLEIFGESPCPVRCFVNCGGPGTSLGLSDRVLELGYGLLERPVSVPQGNERGLIFEYLERGVPVIHLLYARGICGEFDIPYGSSEGPLSFLGEGVVYSSVRGAGPPAPLVSCCVFPRDGVMSEVKDYGEGCAVSDRRIRGDGGPDDRGPPAARGGGRDDGLPDRDGEGDGKAFHPRDRGRPFRGCKGPGV